MSDGTGTWSIRLIGAGCAVVIVVGAFGISGHKSGESSKPNGKIVPVGASPSAPGSPGSAPTPKPAKSSPGSTSGPITASPSAPSAPVGSPSQVAVPSTAASPTARSTPTVDNSASPTPTASAHATSPIPPGVLGSFSYATTGYEQTSIPGTKRTFPSTTTITNKQAGCGVESTWAPSSQHVQTQELCGDGRSIYMASYATTLTFFGISSGEDFKCGTDAVIYAPGAKAGQVWNYKCTSSDATATQAGHVIGYSSMSVGGTSVRVLHVEVATTLTGSDSGKSTQDYWIEIGKPVLVKETGTVDASQKGIHYEEAYSLTLDSLRPKA
jgi:hypothetical protein